MLSLTIETIPADNLPQQMKDLLSQAYQREFSWDKMIYDDSQWFVIGTRDQELAGQVGILQREISVDGHPLRVGGIHGVITEPEHRCRGVASALMGRAVDFIGQELHLPCGLLTCQPRLEAFYNRLRWKTTKETCVFEQPDGPRSCGGLTMVVECGEISWPEGRIDLRGLPW